MASSFGTLHTLPSEIRSMIYERCVANRSIGLLLANKRLYNESVSFLREKFVLSLRISPSAPTSAIEILNQNRAVVNTASCHPDHNSVLEGMPVDKFRKVEIFIEAPDPKDSGQLVRAWKQVTALLAVLLPRWNAESQADVDLSRGRQSAALPALRVCFKAAQRCGWSRLPLFQRRMLNRSVPNIQDWNPVTRIAPTRYDKQWSDLQLILAAFHRVRAVGKLEMRFPRHVLPCVRSVVDTELCLESVYSAQAFGLTLPEDDVTLAQEDLIHAWLDYLLDDMKGPTAALLRRERFENWCPEYDYLMGERLYGRPSSTAHGTLGDCCDMITDQLHFAMEDAYMERYAASARLGEEIAALKCETFRALMRISPAQRTPEQSSLLQELIILPVESHRAKFFPDGIPFKSNNPLWPKDMAITFATTWGTDWDVPIAETRDDATASHALGAVPFSIGSRCAGAAQDSLDDAKDAVVWASHRLHRNVLALYLHEHFQTGAPVCVALACEHDGHDGDESLLSHIWAHVQKERAEQLEGGKNVEGPGGS